MIENKVRCVHWQATYKNKNSNTRIKQNHIKVIEHFNFKENIICILNLNPTNFSYYENWQFNMVSKSSLAAGHIFYIFESSLHNLHICFSSYSICSYLPIYLPPICPLCYSFPIFFFPNLECVSLYDFSSSPICHYLSMYLSPNLLNLQFFIYVSLS